MAEKKNAKRIGGKTPGAKAVIASKSKRGDETEQIQFLMEIPGEQEESAPGSEAPDASDVPIESEAGTPDNPAEEGRGSKPTAADAIIDPTSDSTAGAAEGAGGGGGGRKINGDPLSDAQGPLRNRIETNFLEYASYVIRDRAIPKLDDGLKPVQRRIMWSLHRNDDGKFIKVANIVGYCMQFHPHGDVSITDALVVITNKRYLIEGQGNFGNVFTGDRAAASRYIECRLTELARREIFNDELTELIPSYDGRNKEPVTLPAKLPLLLMLGTEGIAVGLSSRILPHNFGELLEAQIAILRKQPFKVLPDFQNGCLMDATEYDDGKGSVRLRARIQVKDQSTLVIREIPHGTNSESIIGSIEDAAKKGRIKIRSISDFTAEKIEIEIKLSAGAEAKKVLQALYAFTDCETSITSRVIVIHENRPVEMTVSEVLKHATKKLVRDLERELELTKSKLLDEQHFKTLVQIFVENRIYKAIENSKTNDAVFKAVFDGFVPFRKQLIRELTQKDVEMLLAVHIRRISLFDIQKHRDDMERIARELTEIEKNLKSIIRFTINRLKELIKTYGKEYPRLTEITRFDTVTAKEVAMKTLTVAYDRDKGFVGYQVTGKEFQIKCSQYDKIVVVFDDGTFKVMPAPDKLYVGKGLVFCDHIKRDQIITMAYRHRETTYLKRFTFGGTIQNKVYRCAPEKSKVLFFERGTPEEIYIKYKPSSGQRIHQQIAVPKELSVKSAKARGNQISIKKIANISSSRPRNWDKETNTPKILFA